MDSAVTPGAPLHISPEDVGWLLEQGYAVPMTFGPRGFRLIEAEAPAAAAALREHWGGLLL
jgi:hypothetical protein